MYGGEEERVKLLVKNSFAGIIIDRFGKDVTMIPVDEENFSVNVEVQVSGQFFSWVFALGDGVKIMGPEKVVSQVKEEIERLKRQYSDPLQSD